MVRGGEDPGYGIILRADNEIGIRVAAFEADPVAGAESELFGQLFFHRALIRRRGEGAFGQLRQAHPFRQRAKHDIPGFQAVADPRRSEKDAFRVGDAFRGENRLQVRPRHQRRCVDFNIRGTVRDVSGVPAPADSFRAEAQPQVSRDGHQGNEDNRKKGHPVAPDIPERINSLCFLHIILTRQGPGRRPVSG